MSCVVEILLHCGPQHRTLLCVVAHNAEKCSTFLSTTVRQLFLRVVGNDGKNCSNFSSCVFFHVVVHNTYNFFALLTTAGKMIDVVAYTGENGQIQISPRIRIHMQIYTRISIRGQGWCISRRKLRWKLLRSVPLSCLFSSKMYFTTILQIERFSNYGQRNKHCTAPRHRLFT